MDVRAVARQQQSPQYTLIIPGRAFSAQASRRSRNMYKARIREVAAQSIPEPLKQNNLYVKVDYLYIENRVEEDNLLKLVRDALKGIAYLDDAQISESRAIVHDKASTPNIEPPMPPDIVDLIVKNQEFVIVTIGVRRMLFIKTDIQMVEGGEGTRQKDAEIIPAAGRIHHGC